MSRFVPTTAYAEDQPLAQAILTTHVLHRGLQAGAATGIATGAVTYAYRLSKAEVHLRQSLRSEHFLSSLRGAVYPTFSQTVFRHAGVGSAVGAVSLGMALAARMYGKEDIEWKDRSWRLLQNQGQLQVDDWSVAGALTGAVTAFMKRDIPRQIASRAAVGTVVGAVGYLGWQYRVMKGKSNNVDIRSGAPADTYSQRQDSL